MRIRILNEPSDQLINLVLGFRKYLIDLNKSNRIYFIAEAKEECQGGGI